MHKELVRRSILILVISLVAFLLISLFITSFVSNTNLAEDLLGVTKVFYNQLQNCNDDNQIQDLVKSFTDSQDTFSISIADVNGEIWIDSNLNLSVDGTVIKLSDREMKIASDVEDFETYALNGNMCCIFKLKSGLICRISVRAETTETLFLYGVLLLIALLAIVIAISNRRISQTSAKVVDAFNSVTKNLRLTVTGNYKPMDINHEYIEVERAFREINTINNSIYQYVNQISAERDKLNYIVQNVAEGLVIIAENGVVYAINNYACKVFSCQQDSANVNYHQLIKDDVICDKIADVFQTGQKVTFDYHDKTSDQIYLSSINLFEASAQGGEKFVSLILFDVTARRREQRNRADFIANASHELKTPITSISGFSELIASGMVKDEKALKQYVQRINDEATYMKKTIDALLYLSKLDSTEGKFTDTVQLMDLAKGCAKNFDLIASQKQITLTVQGQPCQVVGEYSLLEHMLGNLIDNAIKYTNQGGSVAVEVGVADAPYIKVTDNGCGIEPQHLASLFERFYRIDNGRSRDTGGTGLGLSIAHKVCSLHGATMDVDSTFGAGSTFTVQFKA